MLKMEPKNRYQGVDFIHLGSVWIKIRKNGGVFWTRLVMGPQDSIKS